MIFFCILFPKSFGNFVTVKALLQPNPQLAVFSDGWNNLTKLLVQVNAMQGPLRFLKESSVEKHCSILFSNMSASWMHYEGPWRKQS